MLTISSLKESKSLLESPFYKRVLVTGCSGFLGHHLIKELQGRGYYVIGIDKRPPPLEHALPSYFILSDVFDLGFRDLMGVESVFHLAFSTNIPNSVRHPKPTTYENINMTIHLMEVCKDAGVKKFLFPSTASLYGHNPTPWKEDMPPSPIEPYSWQKLSCEYACQMYSELYKLPCVVFRFFQVYGEFQREDTALAAFLRFKQQGKPVTLTQTTAQSSFKSGQRDFIYAGDLAEAIVNAGEIETGKFDIFNIASGEVHTMEEIANALKVEIIWIPRRDYEVERHEGDITKAKSALNWEPKINVIKWLEALS